MEVEFSLFAQLRNWNDPAIATDNPGVNLPSLGIQTFHRSDGSGTSYNFSNYLANAPGQATLNGQGYVELPENLRSQVQQSINSIS